MIIIYDPRSLGESNECYGVCPEIHTLTSPGLHVRSLDLNSSLRHLYVNIKLLEREHYKEMTEFIVPFLLEAILSYSSSSYLLARKMSTNKPLGSPFACF